MSTHNKTFVVVILASALLAGCGREDAAETGAAQHAADTHEEAQRVRLSAEQLTAASIETLAAGPARIRETLPLYGAITPNATAVRQVSARYPGVIRTVAKSFGDPVREGETLATVESNESLQVYNVTAPLSGVVTERGANPGEQTGERALFTVADLSSVWVEVALFPRDVGKVRAGQRVSIQGAEGGTAADGEVIWIAPFGSSANQTLTARVLLDNAERRWSPGLYVNARIALGEFDVPIAVRNAALQTLDERTVVFVDTGNGFEPRAVQVGRADAEATEVITGLDAGARYVARNSFILKAELGKGEAEHED